MPETTNSLNQAGCTRKMAKLSNQLQLQLTDVFFMTLPKDCKINCLVMLCLEIFCETEIGGTRKPLRMTELATKFGYTPSNAKEATQVHSSSGPLQ